MIQGQLENNPVCPNDDCKKLLGGFIGVGHNHKPLSGDVTICIGCAWVLQFDDDLQLGVFQIGDYMELAKEEKHKIDMAQHYVISRLKRKALH